MTAQNIIDAIRETSRRTTNPDVAEALRGIVARAQRYELHDTESPANEEPKRRRECVHCECPDDTQ